MQVYAGCELSIKSTSTVAAYTIVRLQLHVPLLPWDAAQVTYAAAALHKQCVHLLLASHRQQAALLPA